jgi:hypothetical protein
MPAAARNHADTRSCRVGVGVRVRSGGPFSQRTGGWRSRFEGRHGGERVTEGGAAGTARGEGGVGGYSVEAASRGAVVARRSVRKSREARGGG